MQTEDVSEHLVKSCSCWQKSWTGASFRSWWTFMFAAFCWFLSEQDQSIYIISALRPPLQLWTHLDSHLITLQRTEALAVLQRPSCTAVWINQHDKTLSTGGAVMSSVTSQMLQLLSGSYFSTVGLLSAAAVCPDPLTAPLPGWADHPTTRDRPDPSRPAEGGHILHLGHMVLLQGRTSSGDQVSLFIRERRSGLIVSRRSTRFRPIKHLLKVNDAKLLISDQPISWRLH